MVGEELNQKTVNISIQGENDSMTNNKLGEFMSNPNVS